MSQPDCLRSPGTCAGFKRTQRLGDGDCAGPNAGPVVHIVGKDAAYRRALAMTLRAAGYCAQAFPSAMAFVRVAVARRDGCLVIDHHPLNGVDGLTLLERLPALGITLPAILVDGSNDDLLARRALALGAAGVLHKPLAGDAIVVAVGRVTMPTAA